MVLLYQVTLRFEKGIGGKFTKSVYLLLSITS